MVQCRNSPEQRVADYAAAQEQARWRELLDGAIVGEHETRVEVELLVLLVISKEAALVARVGPLHVLKRAEVEVLGRRPGVRNELITSWLAGAGFEEVVAGAIEFERLKSLDDASEPPFGGSPFTAILAEISRMPKLARPGEDSCVSR